MKPIEPGCRAVCVHPLKMGLLCEVIRAVGYGGLLWATLEDEYRAGCNGWVVEKAEGGECFIPAPYLIRIDDDHGGNDEVITEVEVTYVAPEGVAVCQ